MTRIISTKNGQMGNRKAPKAALCISTSTGPIHVIETPADKLGNRRGTLSMQYSIIPVV